MTLSMLSDPEAVRTALRECDRLGRTAFLSTYGFGRSREYMLRDQSTGRLYDSKAIAGAAHGHQFPTLGPLRHQDFTGGEDTVQRKLEALGFEVVRIGENWSREEVDAVVDDYLAMLSLESAGTPYSKADHNAALRERLTARSKGSVELKHQNISAVLDELGLPFIRGYKPRGNFQELLQLVVLDRVQRPNTEVLRVIENLEAVSPVVPTRAFRDVVVGPPSPEPPSSRRRPRTPRKIDYAARDEQNRGLGRAGESWVMDFERNRLQGLGRADLAARVEWISDRDGDGTGFDIKSFEGDGRDRFIEVKTTNGGILTPFVVSANELEVSAEIAGSYVLYRVFDFRTDPRLFMIHGNLREALNLDPIDYRARVKGRAESATR